MIPLDRRDFLKAGAGTALGVSLAPGALLGRDRNAASDRLRLGFIGMGGRGTWLLGLALQRDDTEVKAVCDIVSEKALHAADLVTDAGGKEPRKFTAGEEDYVNLLERDDIDAVIIATPWRWHTTMAIAAMEQGKAVGVEVPAATTVQECWDLVETHERTGMPLMMMENVCYRRDVMAVLQIVREGLLGEMMHLHCGYQHDLRAVKFNPGAELYPTHGIGPVANWLDINRGNLFVSLTSHATKTRGLHEYIVSQGGEDHPNADVRFKLGDIVTTIIHTRNGETVMVSHDTNLPRPYSLAFRVQGTRGLWMNDNSSIYIEGVSPEAHRWEPFDGYQEKHDHPLWKRYSEDAEGAGHGGMDFFVMNAFVESVKRGEPTPLDVYDAAAWSVIGPLSERSIAMGGHPVAFPDFTRGQWAKRKPVFALGDEY